MSRPTSLSRRQVLGAITASPFGAVVNAATALAQTKTVTFLLVHGAWHGGWCWKKLTPLLQVAGHQVFTPTLTGLGERSHLLSPAVDLTTHIQDITAVLEYEDLQDVVLVGHSYGGMVIAGVAEQAGARLAQLVYLDAFLPEDGKALKDYAALNPGTRLARASAGETPSIRCHERSRHRLDGSTPRRPSELYLYRAGTIVP